MKGCFTTLLLATVAAFIAAFFGRSCHHQAVEELLDQRVASKVQDAYPGVEVKYDHFTAMVTGQASEQEVDKISAKIRELAFGNGRVHFNVSPPAPPEPKVEMPYFTITREANRVLLAGKVNSVQTKAYLGQAAMRDLRNLGIQNSIEVGTATAPYPDFGNVVKAIPVLMKSAEDGRVEANPERVIISGTVKSQPIKRSLLDLFASEKWSDAEIVDQIRVKVPERTDPSRFSIVKSGGKLMLSGTVDGPATRKALGDAARLEGTTTDNQIAVSETVLKFPALAATVAGIPTLLKTAENAKLDVSPEQVVLAGSVEDQAAKDRVLSFFSGGKWKGPKVVDQLKVTRIMPLEIAARRNGSNLVLTGKVDSQKTKNLLGNTASVEGVAIDNRLEISKTVMVFPGLESAMAGVPALVTASNNAKVEFNPNQLVLSGQVDSRANKNAIMAFYSKPDWKGPKVVDRIKVKPSIAPSFVLQRSKGKVTLTGAVDQSATKTNLGKAAKVDGVTVDNRIKVNEEIFAFPDLSQVLAGIPLFINATNEGQVKVDPKNMDLSGELIDQPAKNRLSEFFSAANWKGPKVTNRTKLPSKPTRLPGFAIARNQDKVTLTGTVGSAATRNKLVEAAKVDGVTVINQIKVSDEFMEFPDFGSTLGSIPALINVAKESGFKFTPGKIVVSPVKTSAAQEALTSLFSADQWKGPKLDGEIAVAKPPAPSRPSVFVVQRSANKLTLTGTVDSETTKTALGNASKVKGVSVDNRINVSDAVRAFPGMPQTVKGIPVLVSAATNAKLQVDADKVILSGLVNNKRAKDSVLEPFSADGWKGPKLVDQIKIKPPKVAPTFTWKQNSPEKVTLTGKVPNVKIRDSIVNPAKKRLGDKVEVVDQIEVNSNVRQDPWLSALPEFATQVLPKVSKPTVEINAGKSLIAGRVANGTVMNDVSLAFSGINPPGKLDVQLEVAKPEPPKVMPARTVIPNVELTGAGKKRKLVGRVPNKKTHDQIMKTINSAKGIEELDKKLEIGNDVREENYLEPLPKFIDRFYNSQVEEGEFWLRNKELTLRGFVPDRQARDRTVKLAAPLSERGVRVIDLLSVKNPGTVETKPEPVKMAVNRTSSNNNFPASKPPTNKAIPAPPKTAASDTMKSSVTNGLKKRNLFSVYFGTGESYIRSSQVPRAEKLLNAVKQTTGKIRIDGFADERGPNDMNELLSEKRAKRIRAYLIENGVDENRIISVVGRGEIPNGRYREYRRADVRIIETQ